MARPPDIDGREPEPEDFSPAPSGGGAELGRLERVIEEVLGRGGTLAARDPGYEERPQQIEMARLVARALVERRHAVIEAGTGTGKTLAYLVPALASGLKVVVSTATRALQEQLAFKDLPLLAELGADFSFQVMKGRQNYLCLQRFGQFEAAPVFVSREEARQYAKLRDWAQATKTGDRAELDLPERYAAWREVSSTAETCLGQPCPRWNDCHVVKMRQRAQEADVVVVNHHLYFADLAVRRSSGGRGLAEVVPRHEAVIFDEAHNLEEIATEFFGAQLSNYRIFDLCRDLDRAARVHAGWPAAAVSRATHRLGNAAEDLFGAVAATAPEAGARPAPTPARRGRRPRAAPDSAPGLFAPASPAAPREIAASDEEIAARAVIAPAPAEPDSDAPRDARWALPPEGLASAAAQRESLAEELGATEALLDELGRTHDDPEIDAARRRCGEMRAQLRLFAGPSEPGFVHWAEARGRGVFLRASPVDVAGDLRRELFAQPLPAILTSATLATGGDTRFFRRRVGLSAPAPAPGADDDEAPYEPDATELPDPLEAVLASPFDFSRQAALYLPRHLPDPNDPAYLPQCIEELAALTALAGGRTFALFTSLRAMNEAHRRLAPRLPWRVLLQGERPKAALLRAFREEPSVLFATQSFWEGVDVPGDALSLVVIDRLPFASPGDPLVAARLRTIEERGGSSFGEYTLPSAAITLKQGFGRLVRTRRDTGAVAVLDRRLWTKSYGGFFRRSLPPCPTFDRFAELKRWWHEARGLEPVPDDEG